MKTVYTQSFGESDRPAGDLIIALGIDELSIHLMLRHLRDECIFSTSTTANKKLFLRHMQKGVV